MLNLTALDGGAAFKVELSADCFDEICAADAHLEDTEGERICDGWSGRATESRRPKKQLLRKVPNARAPQYFTLRNLLLVVQKVFLMDSVIVTIRSRFQPAGPDDAAPHFRFTFSVIHDQPLFTFSTEIAEPNPDNEAAMRKAAIFEFQVLMAELALMEDSAFISEQ